MAEYIERDMFLKIISCKPSSPTTDREDRLINYCISAVKNFPAADVRPVVRGKWIHTGGKFSRDKIVDRRILTCSLCGNMLSMEGVNAGRGDANYCPNCGADMREES